MAPITNATNKPNTAVQQQNPQQLLNEKIKNAKHITIDENFEPGMKLTHYLGAASTATLLAGGASIFSSAMFSGAAIKNPVMQTVLKNLPQVGTTMAIVGGLGLLASFIADNHSPKLTHIRTSIYAEGADKKKEISLTQQSNLTPSGIPQTA